MMDTSYYTGTLGMVLCANAAGRPSVNQKSEMRLIQSARYEQDGVKFEQGKITFPSVGNDGYFTPERLKEFLKIGRTALARYQKLVDKGSI